MLQITQTNGVKPEHVVQSVMQAGGDQQTVQESVDAGADAAQTNDAVAEGNQRTEDDGPDEQQDDGNHDGNNGGHDSNAALAAEECQPVRQLGILELVVAGSTDDGGQNTDERVASNLCESNTLGSCFPRLCGITGNAADCLDDARSKQTLHHQEADQTGQTGSAVVVIRQTHGSADGEQPSHVVDQGTASLHQQVTNNLCNARDIATLHGGRTQSVTDAHQDTTDGQCSNGKH